MDYSDHRAIRAFSNESQQPNHPLTSVQIDASSKCAAFQNPKQPCSFAGRGRHSCGSMFNQSTFAVLLSLD